MDLARWALGVDYPLEASGMGRKVFFDDDQQTPDTMNVTFNYPDKVLIFEMRIWTPYGMEGQENGVAVYGSEGVIHIGRWPGKAGGWEYGFRAFDKAHRLITEEYDQEDQGWHHRNFLECVRSRKAPAAEIEQGHISSVHSHLANIVARTGRTVRFDAQTQSIPGDPEANRLVGREYRKHWGTPQGV
jgi:predicted dehydrogenase